MPRIVAALGGNTPRYAWNRERLEGITILLDAKPETLADQSAGRPSSGELGVSLEEDLGGSGHGRAPLPSGRRRRLPGRREGHRRRVADLLNLLVARGIS
jgi:hypothetical protein